MSLYISTHHFILTHPGRVWACQNDHRAQKFTAIPLFKGSCLFCLPTGGGFLTKDCGIFFVTIAIEAAEQLFHVAQPTTVQKFFLENFSNG